MTNREMATILFRIAAMLAAQQAANPYRIRAYRNAAYGLLRMREPVAQRIAKGEPIGLPSLGKSLTAKITELATTGHMAFYDQLRAEQPKDSRTLLLEAGLGPAMAQRIQQYLGSTDAASLRRAALAGSLLHVLGVGPKRNAAILRVLRPQAPAYQEPLFT